MNQKTSILIVILLVIAAFLGGTTFAKIRYEGKANSAKATPTTTPQANSAQAAFVPKKTDKPEVKFFVMSFCPYGNQAEAGLEPVYQLLKNKVDWRPQYIVDEAKSSCEQNCPYRVYDDNAKSRCEQAIAQGQIKDMETCKKYFPYTSAEECLKKECANLKAGVYTSLHGDQELHQDIREICALNLVRAASSVDAMDKWWKFISLVNEKCTSTNADTCWKAQATAAGLDATAIANCQSSQTKDLLDKEIAVTTKYKVSGSPTFYINDVLYQGGRAPEDLKKAICSSFNNPPAECNTVLGEETAPASGGCN